MAEMLDIQTAQIIKGHLVGVSVTLTDQLFGVLRTAHFMINTVYTKHRKMTPRRGRKPNVDDRDR